MVLTIQNLRDAKQATRNDPETVAKFVVAFDRVCKMALEMMDKDQSPEFIKFCGSLSAGKADAWSWLARQPVPIDIMKEAQEAEF